MEVLPHVTAGAWDPKAIAVRVRVDVRRDFAFAFSLGGKPGGTITFGSSSAQEFLVEHSRNRGRFLAGLSRLERILNEFVELLEVNRDEKAFQEFLTANPVLLDVYAEASFPKERLQYPTGESPLGKAYVEPDFIVRLPGNLYRLVELESPSKKIATEHGETRAGLNQAAFQIGEWRTYIQKHYDLLKDKFPGIAVNQTSMVVISRSTQSSFGNGRDMRSYMELVRNTLKVDEVLTYDDLLGRARQAYAMLSTLGESG
jgi:hypothetical protein